ncbi:MAG: hypothetical protein M1825_004272 [Sarcosagium campestre]|nr:MAG: hypothetical protein M1825_004272 [Sarcosagium campestre]
MEYIIRFVQVHETFRRPEIEALAEVEQTPVEFLLYDAASPFCTVKLKDERQARALVKRSVLSKAIYELWASGKNYDELHRNVQRTSSRWPKYKTCSFRFDIDSYGGKRNRDEHRRLIDSFLYLGFEGPILMKDPEQAFCIFEHWEEHAAQPSSLHFGRWVADGGRDAITKYDLKKRRYISTTSMDCELSLITANLALAAPGKILYDPFVGTGGFPIACAHFGAQSFGSDLDGRVLRGKPKRNIISNFEQYELSGSWLGGFVADLTNTPIRRARLFDGILCDPPYGVREGLKVLGSRDPERGKEAVYKNGEAAHLYVKMCHGFDRLYKLIKACGHSQAGYIPPKKPYSFLALLDDILELAASTLVDGGRLSLWMPTANDEQNELQIPSHPCLENVSVCVQTFNKWSRRLLTYRRLSDLYVDESKKQRKDINGSTADDLNSFRKRYFQGFKIQHIEPETLIE